MPHVLILGAVLALYATQTLGADIKLSSADTAAAFKAAGYRLKGKQWVGCAPGTLSQVRDINGDGLPEAVITEESAQCHGKTGEGFSLVSKSPKGWRLVAQSSGIATFLRGPTVAGWPDLEVGGPGFCFPVYRWNGQRYAANRYEYQGKRCRPGR